MNLTNLHIYVDEIFSIYDQDNSGTLNPKQLTNFFNGIYQKMNDNQIVSYTHVVNALKCLDPGFTGKADKMQIFNILKKMLEIPVTQTNTSNSIDSNKNYQQQLEQQINSKVMQHKYKIQQNVYDIPKIIQRIQTAPSSQKTILQNKSQPFIIVKLNQSIEDISFSQEQFKQSFIQQKSGQCQFANNYKQFIQQPKAYLNNKQKQILNLENNKYQQNSYNVKYFKEQQPRYLFNQDTQNLSHNLQRVKRLNQKLNDYLKNQNNSSKYDIKQLPIQKQQANITPKSQKSNPFYPEYNANRVEQKNFFAGPVEQFSFGKQTLIDNCKQPSLQNFFQNPRNKIVQVQYLKILIINSKSNPNYFQITIHNLIIIFYRKIYHKKGFIQTDLQPIFHELIIIIFPNQLTIRQNLQPLHQLHLHNYTKIQKLHFIMHRILNFNQNKLQVFNMHKIQILYVQIQNISSNKLQKQIKELILVTQHLKFDLFILYFLCILLAMSIQNKFYLDHNRLYLLFEVIIAVRIFLICKFTIIIFFFNSID